MGHKPLIDKTYLIPDLIDKTRVVFLRPRRFGKSLTLSMLKYFFYGTTNLFQHTKVFNQSMHIQSFVWQPSDQSQHSFPPCPVPHFDFSASRVDTATMFEELLITQLQTIGRSFCVPESAYLFPQKDSSMCLGMLIETLCKSKWNI